MRIGAFELNEPLPQLKEPHVFAMVRPWVDVGSVGTLTLNRLERFLGSKELGRLVRPGTFFDFTRYRPNMRLVDGKREVKIPNSIIRYAITENGPDYLFLHLMEPHSNGEDYTDSILELVNHFKVKRYCRLGAMYDAVPHTRPLLVTGSLGGVPQNRPVANFKIRQSTYQGPDYDHEPALGRCREGGHRVHQLHGPSASVRTVGRGLRWHLTDDRSSLLGLRQHPG